MSTYGTYINGEDPNKKDPNAVGATTPTTPPVLTYEGFIGTGTASNAYQAGVGLIGSNYTTAVNAANTNKQLGMNYAQGVKNSAYSSAENLRQQTDANTEAARQRGIIDSNSSYQKAIGTYGANAEALGNSGLGASGYGEYLNADAYATHRGQVQSINADALKANRDSAYLEAQTKAAADSEYLKNIYGIESEHNTAMSKAETEKAKGLYELGVGLDTARDEAYTALIDEAANGTSLDIIKQSGAWGDLTPEQQNTISKSYYDGGVYALMSAEQSAGRAYSKSEAESALRGAGYGEADVTTIIASWQESNYKEFYGDANLTEETINTAEAAGQITAEQARKLRNEKLPAVAANQRQQFLEDMGLDKATTGTARWDGNKWVYPNASHLGANPINDPIMASKLNEAYPDAQTGFMVTIPGGELGSIVYIKSGNSWLVGSTIIKK